MVLGAVLLCIMIAALILRRRRRRLRRTERLRQFFRPEADHLPTECAPPATRSSGETLRQLSPDSHDDEKQSLPSIRSSVATETPPATPHFSTTCDVSEPSASTDAPSVGEQGPPVYGASCATPPPLYDPYRAGAASTTDDVTVGRRGVLDVDTESVSSTSHMILTPPPPYVAE